MNDRMRRIGLAVLPIVLAAAVAVLLLLAVDAPPLRSFNLVWNGSLGTTNKLADTLLTWVPLVLAAAGLIITFAAGLWNIGIEGQIVIGAILATWVAREVPGEAYIIIPATLLAGMIGGIIWGLLAGVLRVYGKVNEIFGGLGLDFVATGLAVYLIIGPWQRAGVASTSGTDLFRAEVWMPEVGGFSWLALTIAVIAVIAVFFLMRGTAFGLKLKAVGANNRSAFLLGIPTDRYMLAAFALCGALAGLAGTVQATAFHHKLVPSISGGYGFLGILVVLLAAFRTAWIAPIALFFMALSVGSTQLSLRLGLDSAIGGVLQGVLVLFALLAGGVQAKRHLGKRRVAGATLVES